MFFIQPDITSDFYSGEMFQNILGSFSFKGTTKEPRFGNPTPRIAECEAGMINAVGLQNPGVENVIKNELPKLRKCFNKPVMANVSGFSVEDYAYTCEKLDNICFAGTTEQWQQIALEDSWCNSNTPAKVVHCSDGDVKL